MEGSCLVCLGALVIFAIVAGLWRLFENGGQKATREAEVRTIQSLAEIKRLSPRRFEHLCAELFQREGWKVRTTTASGDQGVDLWLHKEDKRAIVQCKRYDGAVPPSVVREIYGVLVHLGVDEAFVVTTGSFSSDTRGWVGDKPIRLISGLRLAEWVKGRGL